MNLFQTAYRAAHSTETALMKIQNDLLRTLDNHGAAILILLDLSAAFDTIDHEVLLDRMKSHLGIDGTVLQWFRSYLTGRSQHVKINDAISAIIFLLYGVPQGSVLGPLLFLIYLLPLGHLIRSFGLCMHGYADDTQIYVSFTSPRNTAETHDIGSRIEQCLLQIHRWMTANKLKLNTDKTEILLVGTKKNREHINLASLSVAGIQVKVAESPISNLGAVFDPTLNMVAQVNKMVKTASFHLRNIGHVRRRLTEDTAKKVIQSLVLTRLDYCNSLLCGIPDKQLHRLQQIQNKAARLITLSKQREHITPILKKLHWLPVKYRIDFKVLLLVYKALNGKAPVYIRDMLINYHPHRQLRSSVKDLLVVPRINMASAGHRSFSVYAPHLWNTLELSIKQSASVQAFKTNLKTLFFSKYYLRS